jgi:hypothetical protein
MSDLIKYGIIAIIVLIIISIFAWAYLYDNEDYPVKENYGTIAAGTKALTVATDGTVTARELDAFFKPMTDRLDTLETANTATTLTTSQKTAVNSYITEQVDLNTSAIYLAIKKVSQSNAPEPSAESINTAIGSNATISTLSSDMSTAKTNISNAQQDINAIKSTTTLRFGSGDTDIIKVTSITPRTV